MKSSEHFLKGKSDPTGVTIRPSVHFLSFTDEAPAPTKRTSFGFQQLGRLEPTAHSLTANPKETQGFKHGLRSFRLQQVWEVRRTQFAKKGASLFAQSEPQKSGEERFQHRSTCLSKYESVAVSGFNHLK